jgi:hypothetical protein
MSISSPSERDRWEDRDGGGGVAALREKVPFLASSSELVRTIEVGPMSGCGLFSHLHDYIILGGESFKYVNLSVQKDDHDIPLTSQQLVDFQTSRVQYRDVGVGNLRWNLGGIRRPRPEAQNVYHYLCISWACNLETKS